MLDAVRAHRAKSVALGFGLGLTVVGVSTQSVEAASATWNASPTNGIWEAAGVENNWSTGAATFPGALGSLTNADVATFLTSATTTISINSTAGNSSGLGIGGIAFGNVASASAFTIGTTGGNSLLLSSGGQISISSGRTVAGAAEIINAPIVLEPASGTTAGTYTFSNASGLAGDIFTFGGAVTGGTTNQGITLTLTGSSTTANTIGGVVSDGGATGGVSINKTSSGSWALSGINTYTGTTSVAVGGTLSISGQLGSGTYAAAITNAGTINFSNATQSLSGAITGGGNLANTGNGNLTLNGAVTSALGTLRATAAGTVTVNNAGANVTVASNSAYGSGSSNFGKFILTDGTVTFTGGIQSSTASGTLAGADGMGFIVNGGTFSASSVGLGRSFNFSTTGGATTTTAQAMGTNGFQVNGGTATVSGAVNLVGSNSAANGQVSGTGGLTIGGELVLGGTGNAGTTRTTLFQVTGGTLTNNDTTGNGIVLGKGTTTAASGELLLTGGTTTTNKIAFGVAAGLAGSFGNLTLNGAGASLYIGSGGIVNNATNAFTQTIDLRSGTLGASAGSDGLSTGWSSSLAMALNGSGVTIKAADASNVGKNISLSGVLSGANGFIKAGGGSLTLSNANIYTGATTVQAGKLIAGVSDVAGTSGAFGNAASAIVLGNGSTLAGDAPSLLINGAFTVGRDITVGSAANAAAYNATIGGGNTTGTSSFTGNITLNTTAANYKTTLQAATGGTVDFNTGTWTTNNKAIAIGSAGNTGTVQLSKALPTTGTSGGVSVNFGTLSLNIADALGTSNATPVTVNGGTLAIGANNQTAVGTVILSSGSIAGSSGVLTSNATYDVRNGLVGATLGGSVGLTKTTSSTVTLSGTNTYTGDTAVTVGTLLVSGSISGSVSTVSNAGSVLGGTGAVGAVTVNSGAALQGGDGVTASGALTTAGNVSLNDGSIIKLTLGTGLTNSRLAITGGTWTFDPVGGDQLFSFIDAGATTGTYTNLITGLAADPGTTGWLIANSGWVGTFSYNGGNIDLNLTAIPVPGSAVSLLGGMGCLLGLQRFRRRASQFKA